MEANPVAHVHIATITEYEAILLTPRQARNIICRIQAFARLLTLLVVVTGLRIGEVLALRWKHVDWGQFRIRVVSNFVRGKFGEPKSAASKKPVVLHPIVMGLLKNWRETTAYAGDEEFMFASARLKGKLPASQQQEAFSAAFRGLWTSEGNSQVLIPVRELAAWISAWATPSPTNSAPQYDATTPGNAPAN